MRHRAAFAMLFVLAACQSGAKDSGALPGANPDDCTAYQAPPLNVGAETHHLKTAASVVAVTSPCTLRVRIGGGFGTLELFTNRVIVLRVTERTTFNTAAQGDKAAIGRFGLKSGDVFGLSFDSRPFPDGSYPLNYMNW